MSATKQRGPSDSPLLETLPKEKQEEILRALKDEVLPAGTMVFRQGDPGDCFYLIRSGRVRIFRQDDEGLKTDLSEMGPGESFGEMALLTGQPRSANVETLEQTRLSVLPKKEFDNTLKGHPELSLAFVKQMSRWLMRDEERLEIGTRRDYRPPPMTLFDFVFVLGLSVLVALGFNQSNPNGIPIFPKAATDMPIETIGLEAASGKHTRGETLFVDAMPSNFYDKEHIQGAVNLPLSLFEIMYMMGPGMEDKDRDIIVYGRTISKRYDEHTAAKLLLRGHKNVAILEKGFSEWKKRGYPIEP